MKKTLKLTIYFILLVGFDYIWHNFEIFTKDKQNCMQLMQSNIGILLERITFWLTFNCWIEICLKQIEVPIQMKSIDCPGNDQLISRWLVFGKDSLFHRIDLKCIRVEPSIRCKLCLIVWTKLWDKFMRIRFFQILMHSYI